MDRVFKWLTLLLIVIEVILVRSGLLDLTTAVGIIVVVEVLLLAVAGRQVIVAVRRYRGDRAGGLDVWTALEDGMAVLLPRPLARFAALEPKVWICLALWLFRRHSHGLDEFSYHRRSIVGSLLVVVLFTTPVELLLFEILIPWTWLRWTLLVLAVYTLIWAFGFFASLHVLSHRLETAGVRLRYGILADGLVPYAEIDRVERENRRAPGIGDGLRLSRDESAVYVSVGGRTDVSLILRSPFFLNGLIRPIGPASIIHVAVDEPERFVEELAHRTRSAGHGAA